MSEFRRFAEENNDAPEVGDVVQLLDDNGTPDINKVPISEIVREVDRTSLTGDTGITPALSQVWEVKDDQGQNWMVARNPETDEGGKKGYLQVRIAASEHDKELEIGIKTELEHKDTFKKFRKNPEMTDKEVAEMIAKNHLNEKKDYYSELKEMETKASLLKESIIHTKNTGRKDSWDRELWRGDDGRLYVDVEGILHSMTSEGEPTSPAVNVVKGDAEDQLSNPMDDVGAKSHYDGNQSIASLLNLPIGTRVTLLKPFWGHKPGEIGKIDRNGKLRLKGSPPATISEKDADDLFEILAPKLQGWPEMSVADVDRMSPYSNKTTEASLLKESSDKIRHIIDVGSLEEADRLEQEETARGFRVKRDGLRLIVYEPVGAAFNELLDALPRTQASLLKEERELSVPEKHQLRIAYDTLKMNDVMARVMGGMTKDEAREIIKRLTGRDAKEGAVMNTKASLLKTETRNGDVIHIFLSDTFPKDMSKNWGTGNLKIVKEPDGWSLVNYWTRILYRGVGGKVYFNTKKYSQTTTSIQREIQSIAKELGVKLIPVEDDSLDESIKTDTTPESSPVETTPENPPLEEPQTTEELDRNVIVTNASLLKESGLEEHVMEVLTAAGVAHLVEWNDGKLRLVKKEMGSGSEFADEVIMALGNTGAFGTVTYDVENNQFNLGIQSEPQEVTITSVLK